MKISKIVLYAAMIGGLNGFAYAEKLPIIGPGLNINMPDAVYTDASGNIFRLKANFNYIGVSDHGTFLWEMKPNGYEVISQTTQVPPEEIDCSSSGRLAEGDARTLHNRNNGVDYIINCIFSVKGDLTVDPGVTIQFGTDAGISVDTTGSIQMLGTAGQPIMLTGEDKAPGAWRGVFIDSNDSKNKLQHTNIDYAGGSAFNSNGDLGAVIVWADTQLTMLNTTIRYSASYGFNANYGDDTLTLKDNVMTLNKAPMLMEATYPTVISGGSYIGNQIDAITVVSESITGQHNWKNLGIPYRIANKITVAAGGELTIQPGVTLEFEDDGLLYINEGGSGSAPSLTAVGTPSSPIIFTSVNKVAGAWKGIYFDSPSPLNEIGFATVAYASNPRQEGAISSWADTALKVHDVSLENIQQCGFQYWKSAMPSISNVTYSGVATEQCEF